MKKKALMMMALLCLPLLGLQAWAQEVEPATSGTTGECEWSYDASIKTLTISPTTAGGRMADYELEFGNTSLPETPWRDFGEEINHLVIKDGVTYIGKYSLTAMLIEEINVPNSVTEIAEGGLMLNPYTKKIVVGDGVTSIGKWGFMMSPAREVTLGSGVRFIGEDAMVYEFLYDLTLKGEPFETWTGYEPGGEIKTHDLENEFKIFVSNSTYASWKAKYAETIGDHFFSPIEGGSTWVSGGCEVTIHDDRTMTVSVPLFGGNQMADYASVDDVPWKQYAKEIKQVTFGDGVAKIGANAFAGFTSTLNVYFEGSNAVDWSGAATDFAPITTFHFLQDKPWLDRLPALKDRYCEMNCGDGLIWKYDKDEKVIDIVQSDANGSGGMNDYDVEDNKAPWYSFLHELNNGITINIGKGVTYLGKYAFYDSNIDNVNQPATLTSCGEGTFMNSTITRFEIPAAMTVVPDMMFYNSRLKGEIVIPDGVETIGKRAFAMCSILKRVYLPKSLKTIDEDAFYATDGHCKVYIYAAKPIDITWISSATDFSTDTEFHVLAGHKQTWEKTFPNAQVQFIEDNYSEDHPFELSTANDWRQLCDYVSNGARGICVKMMNDIDLGEDCKFYVGTEANPYQGFFDGQGYTLTYNCKEFKSPRDFNIETGFRAPFHFIGGATIRNLRVDGLHSDFYLDFEVWGPQGIVLDYIGLKGTKRSGGIVGQASGGVNRIENCRMSGKFRYGAAFSGGIIGQVNKGATLYLYNTLFDGESRLARNVNGTIFTYWQYPNECSPFVGRNQGTLNMENCYFSGTANTWGYSVDLLVGRTDASTNATTNVVNCYYNGNLYGLLNNNGGIDASSMTLRQLDDALGSQWRISDDQTTVVPSLLLKPQGGKGTAGAPYAIDNDLDWRTFIYYTTKMDGYDQKVWKQTSNFTTTKWGAQLKGAEANHALYEGNMMTLTLDVESEKRCASPFVLAENADIKKLKVEGTLKGGIHASGLVGNCGETVNITDCVVDADITFGGQTGNNARGAGFVGHAQHAKVNMTECVFGGTLTANPNSEADGTWAGALVGWGESDSELTLTKCVDAGTFDKNIDHPDFIIRNINDAQNSGGTLSDCYFLTGQKEAEGLTKLYPVSEGLNISDLTVTATEDFGTFGVKKNTCQTEQITITYLSYKGKNFVPEGYLTFNGEGTSDSPYEVWSTEAWNVLCTNVAKGETYQGKYFKQMADIDITQCVGTAEYAFCGHYDGNNQKLVCTISTTDQAAAPFYRTIGAIIENLHVTGTISGGIHTGGLVAHNSGTGSSSRTTIRSCRVSATITCTGNNVNNAHGGGIIGHAEYSEYSVINCLFDGKLIAVQNDKGGMHLGAIVGWGGDADNRTISSTMEKGTYEGMDKSLIAFCWKDDDHRGPSDYADNYYFGDLGETSGAEQLMSVTNGTEELELDFNISDYKWQDSYHGAMKKEQYSYRYLIDGTFYTKKGINASFRLNYPKTWNVTKVLANGNAISANEGVYTIANITEPTSITVVHDYKFWTDEGNYATRFSSVDGSTITITSEAELARLAFLVNGGWDDTSGKTYKLGKDLDMSAYTWPTIGTPEIYFLGTFDGDGHTISGLNSTPSGTHGLARAALIRTNNGTVKNLIIANSSFYGINRAAAIVCDNRGLVENCRVESDVIVETTDAEGKCGGVVAEQQNQSANDTYSASEGKTRGCYSAAQVTGCCVGGIVGHLLDGTVEYNVSEATVSLTAAAGHIAKAIGNQTGGTAQFNFYISDTESSNTTDVRAYPVTVADDQKESGFILQWGTNENFDTSKLYFTNGYNSGVKNVSQFKVGSEWYAPKTQNIGGSDTYFSFDLIKEYDGKLVATAENVKVNGETPETYASTTSHYFKVQGDAVVSGSAVITLYDNGDKSDNNEFCLSHNNGQTASVTLKGRTLYKDGKWNTICLPFDLTIEGSILYARGVQVRTLDRQEYYADKGKLWLSLYHDVKEIKAGVPYIIKWPAGYPDIVDPTFKDVTVKYDATTNPAASAVGDDETPVIFMGNYNRILQPSENRSLIYLGSDNKLYYPGGTNSELTIKAFRASFWLRGDLVAGDPAQGVRNIVLDFGDETTEIGHTEITEITEKGEAWYTLDGRRLSGKPAQRGIYINKGKKIIIK